MNKTLCLVIFFLGINTLESMDNKDKKNSIKILDQKNQNDSNKPANNNNNEGCFFCCSKTDCMKNFK